MKTKTNLIQFEAATAKIEYNVTEEGLIQLRKECTGLKASDKESYKVVTQALSSVRNLRTGVEKLRVEYKADALEYGRRIDAEAKRVTALLVEIENPLKTEKDAWDNELARIKLEKEKLERERINSIIDRIERIKNAPLKHQGKNSNELSEIIGSFETNYINMDQFDYAEFAAQANGAKASTSTRLKEMRDLAQKQEIEAIRLAAERKQLEEEKAAWEAKKAAEALAIDITQSRTAQQELADKSNGINFAKSVDFNISNLSDKTAKQLPSNSLAAAIAQVEEAKNQSNIIVTTANNFNKENFPIGKPTYNELVWIIEKMLPRIAARSQDEFIFYDNVRKVLKLIKENE